MQGNFKSKMLLVGPCLIILKLSNIAACATGHGHCELFQFVVDQDVVHDSTLEGHVIKRVTVKSAAQCHMKCKDDCLCVSVNYLQNTEEGNCELNDLNKEMKPAALKHRRGSQYYDLIRSYTVEVRINVKNTER